MKRIIKMIIGITLFMFLTSCDEKVTVTLNYNCDNNDGYTCNVIDSKLNCMILEPQCGNYEFIGWYDQLNGGNLVDLDGDFSKSTTIYAHYYGKDTIVDPTNPSNPKPTDPIKPSTPIENKKYVITFNANGGVGGQNGSISVTYGSSMPGINTIKPSRSGYTFMGWYDNSDYLKGTQYYNSNNISVTKFYKQKDIILYAGWSKTGQEIYTVSFNANNGSGAMASQKAENNSTIILNKNTFKRSGYTFTGWNTEPNGSGSGYINKGNIKVTGNITLYAQWKQDEVKPSIYKITFNANGGNGGQSGSVNVTYGSSMPGINPEKPNRNGYTFMGWYDNGDYLKGNQYYNENGISVTKYYKNGNTTLYAGWSKNGVQNFTITYLPNGATGSEVIQSVVEGQTVTLKSNQFTKLGNTFVSWNTSSNESGTKYSNNASILVNNNITLYAEWMPITYNIEYVLNGGTLGSNSPQSAQYDKLITINNPTKKYTITIDNNGSNSTLSSTSVVANQIFAGWTYTGGNNMTAQYRANAAIANTSWNNGNVKVIATQFQNLRSEVGTVKLIANFNNNTIKLPTTTKSGYTCGYSTVPNASVITYVSGSNYTPTSNIKLYVICNKNAPSTYAITLDQQGGSGGTTSVVATYGNTMPSATMPTRSGYTFGGYFTSTNGGGTQYYNSNGTSTRNWNLTSATTLYAKWTAVIPSTSTITFNANGGSGSMTPQTVNNNQSTIINANTFTKSNAVFTGWNTNVNGTGTSYMDKASITISNNITLYAQWKQGTPLKVASFNVGYFRCGSSTSISCRPSYSDIADLIKNYQLDIVGMQEVRDPFLNSDGSPNNSYIQTIKNRLNYYGYWVDSGQNVNAIISKYQFDNNSKKTENVCSGRRLSKVIYNINGVNISFYNTHFAYDSSNVNCFNYLAEKVKNDSNPVIVTGDFNYTRVDRFNQYLVNPLGLELVAHDNSGKSMNNIPDDYMDSILIRPYGSDKINHISFKNSQTILTIGQYSDHNMVIANLLVY